MGCKCVGFVVIWGFLITNRVNPLPSQIHTLESSCKLSQQGKGLVDHMVYQQIQGQGHKLLVISHHSV